MSRHSKNANTRQYFTYEERRRLMGSSGSGGLYGSKSARLGADSMLPFDACCLCMKPAVRPVLTWPLGHLYCKECILENILQQRKRIARLKASQEERQRQRAAQEEQRKQRAVQENVRQFEQWESGAVAEKHGNSASDASASSRGGGGGGGVAVSANRSGYSELKAAYRSPVFWAPEATPQADGDVIVSSSVGEGSIAAVQDEEEDASMIRVVVDPMDKERKAKRSLRVKDLVELHFSRNENDAAAANDDNDDNCAEKEEKRSAGIEHTYHRYQCPVCVRTFTNATKGVAMRRCGHVVCLACSDKFLIEKSKIKSVKMSKKKASSSSSEGGDGKLSCPVCSESIRDPSRDMIWMTTAGTGFATEDSIPEVRKKSSVAMTAFI